jgi:hypothetical protein
MINRLILGTILTLTLTSGATVGPGIQKEFDTRIGEYLKLRKRAIQGIPALKPKATPEHIQAHKIAVAQAIREARLDAQQGAILTPDIQEHFREIIRSEMRGRQGLPAKAAAKQGNPAMEKLRDPVAVKVNAPYPDSAPLSTVPATLLLRLPKLPKDLDFRFVGRNLILRDVEASVIVDYIPNATP